jgi:3-hydroxyacyl-CoA dehydrogenase
MTIRSVAILGAGTMGAQIAAHVANAGLPVLLLDLTADVAREGLKRARALKPDPFFTTDTAALVSTGGFDTDFQKIATADWIMEAVVERIDVKRPLLERVDAARRPGSIVSTNTSGISVTALAEGRSDDFRRHWLGTHFFNPPRYLHLLELIPTAETDRAVVDYLAEFADHRLGKGVVVAKDTPNFIANHIGIVGVVEVLRALASGQYTVEEIDAITGPALGRPKSATFRTMDIAGIDILAHVAKNLDVELPPIVAAMVERGWIGEKAGQGFYKRVKGPAGSEIETLDPQTMTYRPKQPAKLASLEAARSIEDTGERIKTLFAGKDKVGEFLRSTLEPTLRYTAKVAPEIAYSPADIDHAMKWGFGWDLGPFEIADALGLDGRSPERLGDRSPERLGDRSPERLGDRSPERLALHEDQSEGARAIQASADLQILKSARDRNRVVKKNAGASLIDIGDGVLALEFHSKMNAIGGDTMQMIRAGVKEAAANFAALVVGNDAQNFSVGANLMLLLLEAQEGNWDDIDLALRTFQDATQALRFADVPVIVAPAGMTLGGGCEILLHADRVQAAAESYIGLVEVGVGLIPAGGGTKEMVARASADLPNLQADLLPYAQRVFETIGFAKVSTSAADARRLGFLTDADCVTMNRDRVLADAKALALERVREGYQRPVPRTAIPVGGETVLAALKLGVHLAWRAGRITDHDAVVGRALANVIAGGALPHQTTVSEQYLLDLEREAFLKLTGERKTLERIQHTLKTGKPLRN